MTGGLALRKVEAHDQPRWPRPRPRSCRRGAPRSGGTAPGPTPPPARWPLPRSRPGPGRAKTVNSRGRSVSATPGPLSATDTRTLSPAISADTVTTGGAEPRNRTALSSSCVNSCTICALSPATSGSPSATTSAFTSVNCGPVSASASANASASGNRLRCRPPVEARA